MQVPNQHAEHITGTSARPRVFTDASAADRTLVIDQGGELVLRLWLPGGIAIEDDPAYDWDVYLNAEVDEHDHFVVTNLQVTKRAGGPGITAARLRELPIGAIIDELLSTAPVATMVRRSPAALTSEKVAERLRESGTVQITGDGLDWEVVKEPVPPELLAEARRRTQTQRGRRASQTEVQATLAKVAEVARSSRPGRVLRDLEAAGFGKASRAKKYLRAARDAGLLEESARSRRAER